MSDILYIIIPAYNEKENIANVITSWYPMNSGHGETFLYGYKHALKYRTDYIFQTDSDGQTLPDEFEQFWNERENYDMVISWRKGRQDGKVC